MPEELKQYRALREATTPFAEFPKKDIDKVLHLIMLEGTMEDIDALLTHFHQLREALGAVNEARYKLLSTALKQAEGRTRAAR